MTEEAILRTQIEKYKFENQRLKRELTETLSALNESQASNSAYKGANTRLSRENKVLRLAVKATSRRSWWARLWGSLASPIPGIITKEK